MSSFNSTVKEYRVDMTRTTDLGVEREQKYIAALSRANAFRTLLQTIDRTNDLECLYRHFDQGLFDQSIFNADINDNVLELKIRQSSSISETVVTIVAFDSSSFPSKSEIVIRIKDLGAVA